MAGYKVVLRILAVVLALGLVGFIIYAIVVGGFGSKLSSYDLYKQINDSSEKSYVSSLETNTDEQIALKSYGPTGYDFDNYYTCFLVEEFVMIELGDDLYFSPKKANNKKELDKKLSSYFDSLKAFSNNLKIFHEAYVRYTDEDSEGGEIPTAFEEEQLRNFSKNVLNELKELTKKVYEVNQICYDFVVDSCLGGSVYGSLKYAMLHAIKTQSDVFYDAIISNRLASEVATLRRDYMSTLRQAYKSQKGDNFSSALDEASDAYDFRHLYFDLNIDEKIAYFRSVDKTSYVEHLSNQSLAKKVFTKSNRILGWA